MFRSLKITTAFGIGIYVHWSFLLLLGLVVYLTQEGGEIASVFAVALVLALFTCITLHELGHALTARHFGITTRDITLLPIGGIARLEKMSEKPWEEFCIAIAGPAVNVVIAGVLLMVLLAATALQHYPFPVPLPETLADVAVKIEKYGFAAEFLTTLMGANVGLVLFNMLPAFPMDGGRVFRAGLTALLGQLRATEIAAFLGIIVAAWIAWQGVEVLVVTSNPLILVVSVFVVFAGQQELAAVRDREAMRRRGFIDPPPGANGPHLKAPSAPEPSFSGFTFDRRARVWIEWREGRAIQAFLTHSE
jgi:Zn-dependent protease